MRYLLPAFALSTLLALPGHSLADYATALRPLPVFNTSSSAALLTAGGASAMKPDRCGQVRELEFIALPGTLFNVVSRLNRQGRPLLQVTTEEYRAAPGTSLFIDADFVAVHDSRPPPRTRQLPAQQEIIRSLLSAAGAAYVWGGNVRGGVTVSDGSTALAGLDCSGLLYESSGGWTPRNTSQLVSYGRSVAIAGKTAGEIAGLLQPLDLIVWNGHVLIVLDRERIIESRLECGRPGNGGVVVSPLVTRLKEIMHRRKPADLWRDGAGKNRFVVRRWYP